MPEQSQESRSLKSTDYVTIVQIAKHLFDIHHGKPRDIDSALTSSDGKAASPRAD